MIFQLSWLHDSIVHELSKQPKFSSSIVSKNYVKTLDLIPVLRINNFIKTTKANDITAVLSDSTHKVFAIFPFKPTIVNFENTHNQRITFYTQNCFIQIKKANLRYISRAEAQENFKTVVNGDLVVLEILDLDIFQRDQVQMDTSYEKSLKFVYDEPDYQDQGGTLADVEWREDDLATITTM